MSQALKALGNGQHRHEITYRRRHQVEERRGIQTNPENKDKQRDDGDELAGIEVAQRMTVIAIWAVRRGAMGKMP